MLNKELLMMGGEGVLWVMQFEFDGDSSIKLELRDSDKRLLWEGYPPTDLLTFRLPQDQMRLLFLYYSAGKYDIVVKDGCIVDSYNNREIRISVRQSGAFIVMNFIA